MEEEGQRPNLLEGNSFEQGDTEAVSAKIIETLLAAGEIYYTIRSYP